jgi:large-conductance mechanosensitive channel
MIIEEITAFLFNKTVSNLLVAIMIGNAFADFIRSISANLIVPSLSVTLRYIFKMLKLNIDIGVANIDFSRTFQLFLNLVISTLTLYYLFIKPFSSIIKKNGIKEEEEKIELITNLVEKNNKVKYFDPKESDVLYEKNFNS